MSTNSFWNERFRADFLPKLSDCPPCGAALNGDETKRAAGRLAAKPALLVSTTICAVCCRDWCSSYHRREHRCGWPGTSSSPSFIKRCCSRDCKMYGRCSSARGGDSVTFTCRSEIGTFCALPLMLVLALALVVVVVKQTCSALAACSE